MVCPDENKELKKSFTLPPLFSHEVLGGLMRTCFKSYLAIISRTVCPDSPTSYLEGCVRSVRLDAVQLLPIVFLYLSIFLYLFTV